MEDFAAWEEGQDSEIARLSCLTVSHEGSWCRIMSMMFPGSDSLLTHLPRWMSARFEFQLFRSSFRVSMPCGLLYALKSKPLGCGAINKGSSGLLPLHFVFV